VNPILNTSADIKIKKGKKKRPPKLNGQSLKAFGSFH
jgi:hypothetical protein